MKAYTDLEQSKKLAKILPLESADMEYMFLKRDGSEVSNVPFVKDGFEEPECCYIFIPCWSLAALLEFIPNVEIKSKVQNFESKCWCVSSHDDKDYNHIWVYNDELIDACYEMIVKLKEQNLL